MILSALFGLLTVSILELSAAVASIFARVLMEFPRPSASIVLFEIVLVLVFVYLPQSPQSPLNNLISFPLFLFNHIIG